MRAKQRGGSSGGRKRKVDKLGDTDTKPAVTVRPKAKAKIRSGPRSVSSRATAASGSASGESSSPGLPSSAIPPLEGVTPHPEFVKVSAWNINGLRATLKPSAAYGNEVPVLSYTAAESPDILCLNETKIHSSQEADFVDCIPGYQGYFASASKKGYSGTAIFVKKDLPFAVEVKSGCGVAEIDDEGRVIRAELPGVCIVNCYVANAGRGLVRLKYRTETFDKDLHNYIANLQSELQKPVILCGDLNVAHQEIDIWNSKGNQKSAGHTPQERASFSNLLSDGTWIDFFRHKYPATIQYTYWTQRFGDVKDDNKGWRLDYFVVNKDILPSCADILTREHVKGSDHCPVVLLLDRKTVAGE